VTAADEIPTAPRRPFAVREAAADDLAPIAELEQRSFGGDAWSGPAVAEELAAPGRQSLVAQTGDTLVGYAVTWVVDDVADLQRVVVAGEARRGGVATRLVQELLARAAAAGVRRVLLEVSASNLAALAFYAALGFTEIDRRKSYYRDGSDAVVMQLRLPVARPQEENA
jgi:ribosomal-protein-alanine N-acetyltransferase